ncbi:NAD-dependent succinate-semialdehyde dehydrogenase [Reinekea forsetii]|uniref:Succinate-semialdehyde dehydrogenase (NADP+) n=1 Tax=Reinekea forsetii TaxID=1336806 RepID=A0A2K8KSG6_9GAMM|nr:NAD-dependent succinate-semialdehyde dehydrogenase [Reinekea forsetii]ATX77019.1 succinate-semialdehyde dehydrogenase (NADP+) [Reinekea forsetii]
MTDFKNQLYINGAWRDSASGAVFDVINPFDESVLSQCASAEVADAQDALTAAANAAPVWRGMTPRQRSVILRKAFDLMTARLPEFAELITLENGKAKTDAMGEATYAAEFFRWFSEEAVRADGNLTMAPASGARILVHQKPAGIAYLITPWNYPAAMGTRKIAPALAAGCTVIVKPASETPLSLLALAALLEEAGVPAGVVNILPSQKPAEISEVIMNDPRVRVVSFTGSTGVGRNLLKLAANQVLTPAMELGGNAPLLVLHDADIDVAVEGAMLAKMRNMGEACTAANRLYVHASIATEFTEKLSAAMGKLTVGNGLEAGIDVGPLVNAATRDKVSSFVCDAVEKGAKIEVGGVLPTGPGYFYPPTVLSNVPDNALCLDDEIFGPVAAIQTFTDEQAIIAKANDTEYGLVAYVFTEDLKRGLHISEQLEFGMVGLNRGLVSDPAAPFGGVKQSGLGREGGHEGLMEFMETQYISTVW